jgi:hypothetical protein
VRTQYESSKVANLEEWCELTEAGVFFGAYRGRGCVLTEA